MRDRRYEPRFVTNEAVELRWTDASGAAQTSKGIMRDFSTLGARIQSDRAVRLQTNIQIAVRDRAVTARVKSCSRLGTEFTLGVEFDPEFRDSLKAQP